MKRQRKNNTRADQVVAMANILRTDPSTHHLNCAAIAERLYLRGFRIHGGK